MSDLSCPTCGGTGELVESIPVGHFDHRPCPDCDGSGVAAWAIETAAACLRLPGIRVNGEGNSRFWAEAMLLAIRKEGANRE